MLLETDEEETDEAKVVGCNTQPVACIHSPLLIICKAALRLNNIVLDTLM